MHVFRARDQLIDNCRESYGSFVNIQKKVARYRDDAQSARLPLARLPVVAQSEIRVWRNDHRPGGREVTPLGAPEDLPDQSGSSGVRCSDWIKISAGPSRQRAGGTYVPTVTRPCDRDRFKEGHMGLGARRVSASTLPRGTGS